MRTKLISLVLSFLVTPAGLVAQGTSPRDSKPASPGPIRYALAATGNLARFIVREQLAGATLPNQAIGTTSAITGGIVLDSKGAVDTANSVITVDLRTLESDRDRRDNYIKRRTLVVDSFPNAVLKVRELKGLPVELPASGTVTFTVLGDFTVHGVTKPSVWEATATVANGALTGKATTRVKFGDFGMERPRVMIVLSVEDDIKLEYDFHFVRAESP